MGQLLTFKRSFLSGWMVTVLLSSGGAVKAEELALEIGSSSYGPCAQRVLADVHKRVESLAQIESDAQQIEKLKEIKAVIDREASQAHTALEKAEAKTAKTKISKMELKKIDLCDTDMIHMSNAFEPVFTSVLRLPEGKHLSASTCFELPRTMEFEELGGSGAEGQKLSPVRSEAILLVHLFCEHVKDDSVMPLPAVKSKKLPTNESSQIKM